MNRTGVVAGVNIHILWSSLPEVLHGLFTRERRGPPTGWIAGLGEVQAGGVSKARSAHGTMHGLDYALKVEQW